MVVQTGVHMLEDKLRIGKCMEKMAESQRRNPGGEQLSMDQMMAKAKEMDGRGSLSEDGSIMDDTEGPEEDTADDPSGDGPVLAVSIGPESESSPDGMVQALLQLHKSGAIEIKDPQLLKLSDKMSDVKKRADEALKDTDEMMSLSKDIAERLFR